MSSKCFWPLSLSKRCNVLGSSTTCGLSFMVILIWNFLLQYHSDLGEVEGFSFELCILKTTLCKMSYCSPAFTTAARPGSVKWATILTHRTRFWGSFKTVRSNISSTNWNSKNSCVANRRNIFKRLFYCISGTYDYIFM